MIRQALAATALLTLTSCGALVSGPVTGIELRAPADLPRAAQSSNRQIVVEVPETSGALSSDQVLIRPSSYEASFLAGAIWTDDLPIMVQTLLVRGLQESGGYAYVGREPLSLSADYAVLSELVDFQGELLPAKAGTGAAVQAKITILLRIIRESDARVMGTRTFSRVVPAASDDAESLGAALDQGVRALLPEITTWILGQTGLRVARTQS